MEKNNLTTENSRETKINRKQALQKVGKYAAFTAATMMLLMSPTSSQAINQSPAAPKRHH